MGTTLFNLSELIYLGNRSYLLIHERKNGKICEIKGIIIIKSRN